MGTVAPSVVLVDNQTVEFSRCMYMGIPVCRCKKITWTVMIAGTFKYLMSNRLRANYK